MSFAVVTDTGANITDKVRDHYGIVVVPLTLVLEGEELQFTSTEGFDYDGYFQRRGNIQEGFFDSDNLVKAQILSETEGRYEGIYFSDQPRTVCPKL